MTLQAIYFMKPFWTKSSATKWLKEHEISYIKSREEGNSIRFRVHEPHFNKYRTKVLPGHIYMVLGYD